MVGLVLRSSLLLLLLLVLCGSASHSVSATVPVDRPENKIVVSNGKSCYEKSDEVILRFYNVQDPQGDDWVGIYPDDFMPSEEPEFWLNACGTSTCQKIVTNGTISIPVQELPPGHYTAVLASNTDLPYAIKATSQSFLVARKYCRSDLHRYTSLQNTTGTIGALRKSTPRELQRDVTQDILGARREILSLMRRDTELPARFLRMVFHDCIGGKCDGCVNMNNHENVGVDVPMNSLRGIISRYSSENGLSRADIFVLASFVGVEFLMPWHDRISFRFEHYGRRDCNDDMTRGPNPTICEANMGTNDILQFFEEEFGCSPHETAALMGAHTVGKMRPELLGFDAPNGWVPHNNFFDNEYYQHLIGIEGDLRLAPRWLQNQIADGFPWEGFPSTGKVVMLNADVAMVRQLEIGRNVDADGRIECDFIDRDGTGNQCPSARRSVMEPMLFYAANNRSFLRDFYRVMVKMTNVGYRVDEDTCDRFNVCRLRPR